MNFKETARTTADAELRFAQGAGTAVCRFTIAIDRFNAKKLKEQNKQSCDFINCVCFGKQAEFVGQHLRKGKLVTIEGNVQISKGTDDKYYTQVVCQNVKVLEYEKSNELTEDPDQSDLPF